MLQWSNAHYNGFEIFLYFISRLFINQSLSTLSYTLDHSFWELRDALSREVLFSLARAASSAQKSDKQVDYFSHFSETQWHNLKN